LNMKKSLFNLSILVLSVFLLAGTSPASAQSPRVMAILFFSPACGHCHKVMTEDLPPLQDKYGGQLQIYTVDTSSEEGHVLFESALERYEIPAERRGVPMLVVGETVLVGSQEIPQQLPGMIDSALEGSGIELPDIPGLNVAKLSQFSASQQASEEEIQQPAATISPIETVSPAEQVSPQQEQTNRSPMINKFMQDPTGNTLAVILLVLMTISIVWVIWSFLTKSRVENTRWSLWAVPILSLAGMFVAAYLTYVETTHTQAVCWQNIAVILCWGLVWFGMFFSFYLTFLEPFVIGATCAWCVTSATLMMLLLLATTGPAINAWNPEG
jgi:uncharacterized membrane protein